MRFQICVHNFPYTVLHLNDDISHYRVRPFPLGLGFIQRDSGSVAVSSLCQPGFGALLSTLWSPRLTILWVLAAHWDIYHPLETYLQFLGHGSHSKMGSGTEKDKRLGQVVRERNIERQKQIKG